MEKAAGKLAGIVYSYWNDDEKLNTLKRKLDELTAIEKDINIELEIVESSSSNKKRKCQVENWLTNVGSVKQISQNLEVGLKKSGWCKFMGARVRGLIDEVDELIVKGRFPGGLVREEHENKAEPLLVTKLFGKAFEDNKTKVWKWLAKDEVSRIGIYGMGGVGKTTLVKHIYNMLLQTQNTFNNVYWITVLQDFNIRQLQDRIAKAIKFNLDSEEEEIIRATQLSKALDKKQKFVIILDDLWNQFSLEEVGIPVSCNLIMTTRSLNICWMMCCHKKMKLEPLLKEESWKLFVEKLWNYATLSSQVKEIAMSAARECDGLPLGIVTLAGSMRGVDDEKEWRCVLEQLNQSIIEPGDMDDKVFKVLNLSYERLRDPTLQECFLYCALFPEDFTIPREELIGYLVDEDIIKNLNSIHAILDRGHTLLNRLENACLLEGSSDKEGKYYVKMHDLIRDMAINKMKGNSKAMVKAGEGLKEVPNVIEWSKDLVRVSLMRNYIKKIPAGHSPSCPNLSTLLLCYNRNLEFIADSFFFQLCGLKVLDISYTNIKKLPDSVSNLVSLTSLLLRGCQQLWYIPSLATLKTLKKLDLIGCSRMEAMPRGLELLSSILYLRLDWSTAVKVNSTCLEKVEDDAGFLSNLQYLQCRFPKPQHFNSMMKDFLERPLPSISQLLIGECNGDLHLVKDKLVSYSGCDIGKDGDLVIIPKDLDLLRISRCHTLRSLDNAFLRDGPGEVQIEECDDLQYLISLYRSSSSSTIFDYVMTLCLRDLKMLRDLISQEGAPSASFRSGGVFSCLKCLSIWDCSSITSLFPHELLPNLRHLETIIVIGCKKIEKIISEESNSSSHAEFISLPKLQYLEFRELPELSSICSKKMACDSMETINIRDCPKLKKMPLYLTQFDNEHLSPLPRLQKIKIYPLQWWDSVELEPPNAKDVLEPLLELLP